jgi:hypothetical protein
MTPMGQFRVTMTLNPRVEGEPRRLEALGCEPHRMQPVRFADGRVEEWPVAEVEVECEGRRARSSSARRRSRSWGSASTRSTAGSCRWRSSSPRLASRIPRYAGR